MFLSGSPFEPDLAGTSAYARKRYPPKSPAQPHHNHDDCSTPFDRDSITTTPAVIRLDDNQLVYGLQLGTTADQPRPSQRYCAVMPPSITNSEPVTQDDSSDARNSTPLAISSAVPSRPIDVRSSSP